MYKDLMTNPAVAIAKAKREKSLKKTEVLMVVEWIVLALATALPFTNLNVGVAVFVLGLVSTLLAGFLAQIVFTVLGGRGGFFEGITPIVYSLAPLSLGALFAALFVRVYAIGPLISMIVVAILSAISLSGLYRGYKELFKVDLITAWIGLSILMLAAFLAVYSAVTFYAAPLGKIPVSPTGMLSLR